MATFNGGAFVEQQLRSIAGQTLLPDELVISDDGSSDATVAVCGRFAASAPFLVSLQRNPGPPGSSRNFNHSISIARGDVIVLADQDDVWYPEKLAAIQAAIADADAVFSDGRRIDVDGLALPGTLWTRFGFSRREREMVQRGKAFDVLAAHNVVTGATLAFRSCWREAILPFPDNPHMLHDRWIALILAGIGRVSAIERPLIDYREHAGQQRGSGEGAGWVRSARATTPEMYARYASELRLALERLETLHADTELLARLRQRIAHLDARGSMPRSRVLRLPVVTREMSRYFRYSNHLWSAAKDLLW